MWFFERASDYYTHASIAQQLAWQIGAALLCLMVAFIGYHLFRRAFGRPTYAQGSASAPAEPAAFERYAAGGRLYHWGILGLMVLLLMSGAAFFAPGGVISLVGLADISWLLVHVILGWLFVAFIIVHMGYGFLDTGMQHMLYHKGDGRDFAMRLKHYVWGNGKLEKHGKFNVVQKTYHWMLVGFALVMIGTGISLFLSSEMVVSLSGNWVRWQRLIHDVFSFLFLAVIVAHVYMRLLRTRWPQLVSMITGKLSRPAFEHEHDWDKWKPETATRTRLDAALSPGADARHDGDE